MNIVAESAFYKPEAYIYYYISIPVIHNIFMLKSFIHQYDKENLLTEILNMSEVKLVHGKWFDRCLF